MAPKSKAKSVARSRSATPPAPKAKAKAKTKANATDMQKQPSPEDIAATRIQAIIRGFLARRLLRKMREEKKRYDEELAEAVRQTERALVRQEQRRAEAKRAKDDEKRRKAKKAAEDRKKAMEAAYDGELSTLKQLLDNGLDTDACDAQGVTALSEAASGGNDEVASFLLERKGNPNSRGEFQRTPLWRAAYASHTSMIKLLLEHGGDPRLHDSEGCCPVDVCQNDACLSVLRSWDVAQTDELVEDFESWAEDQRLEQAFKIKQAMQSVDSEYEAAKTANEVAQKALARAKVEFRNRQREHGLGLAAGEEHAILSCKSADEQVQNAEAQAAAAQARFDKASVQRMEAAEECGATAALPGREVLVHDLNNVLMRDIGDRIANGTKWPIMIDPGDFAKKLLLYSGSVLLSFWKPDEMEPDRIRRALLTMIRSGGILGIDLMMFGAGVDRELLSQPFDGIRSNLFEDLLSRSVLQIPKGSNWPRFRELLRAEDKSRGLTLEAFDSKNTARFKLIIVTSTVPHPQLLDIFDVMRVSLPDG